MLALRGQWYVYVGWAHFIVVMVVGDDNLPMTHAYCGFNGWLGMIRDVGSMLMSTASLDVVTSIRGVVAELLHLPEDTRPPGQW